MWTLHNIFICVLLLNVNDRVSAVSLTRDDIMIGQIFPPEISATAGEDIYLKISNPLRGQTRCSYRAPGGTNEITVNTNLKEAGGRWLNMIM